MAVVYNALNDVSPVSIGSSVKYLITKKRNSYRPIFVNPTCKVHIPGWIVRTGLLGLDQYVSYQIVCRFWTDGCINKLIIYKRYSEFYQLHQRLVKKYGRDVLPPFPPKQHEGRFEEDFVELRRVRLEIYLACLAKFYYGDLVDFLGAEKRGTKIQTDDVIQDGSKTNFRNDNERLLKSCLTSSSRRYKRFQVHFSTDVIDNEKASKNPNNLNNLQHMKQSIDIITAYYM